MGHENESMAFSALVRKRQGKKERACASIIYRTAGPGRITTRRISEMTMTFTIYIHVLRFGEARGWKISDLTGNADVELRCEDGSHCGLCYSYNKQYCLPFLCDV